MDNSRRILEQLKNGEISVDEALAHFKLQPFEDIGYAKVDLHRRLRKGVAEVIYGESKTAEQIAGIAVTMIEAEQNLILVTRLDEDKSAHVENILRNSACKATEPPCRLSGQCTSNDAADIEYHYYETARIAVIGDIPEADGIGRIVIATGGTSDIPVAEEAAVTAEALGNEVVRLYDVGVAGIHRLLDRSEEIVSASVVIAIAGMEGALASVIGGMASCPVIAVPTSIGYGAAFEGLTALLSMLNSCATGISVVNIDNGFGAGFLAHKINHMGIN